MNEMLDIIIADLTNPRLWIVMLIWVAIGVINKMVYYEAGERTGEAALEKVHGFTPERAAKLDHLYDRWGVLLLLLSSLPVIGAAITVLAGVDKVGKLFFIVLVAISNLVRNWLIVFLSGGIVALLEKPAGKRLLMYPGLLLPTVGMKENARSHNRRPDQHEIVDCGLSMVGCRSIQQAGLL